MLALEVSLREGRIQGSDRVVLFNTGAAAKYLEVLPVDLPVIREPAQVDCAVFD